MSHRRFRFSVTRLLALVTIATGLVAVLAFYWPTQRNQSRQLFGGSGGVRVVANPDEVQAFRLNADFKRLEAGATDFPVIAGPMPVSRADIERLSATLLSPQSYEWEWAKACAFIPDSKLTFRRGAHEIDVLFCFGCDTLQVEQGGRILGYKDFTARSTFFQVFKNCFPSHEPASQW